MLLRVFAGLALFISCLVPTSAPRAQDRWGDAVECSSRNYQYTRCGVPWRDARLIRQLSDTACIRGQTWGLDRRGLWVDRGCGGRFVEADGRPGPGGWRPEPGWDSRFSVGCGSEDYRYRFCGVDLGGGGRAYLERQTSGSACIEGSTWGWNRAGIWVDQGCAGIFTIDRRWR